MSQDKNIVLIDEFKKNISSIKNPNVLIEEKNIFNKKFLVPLYDELKKVDVTHKKELGIRINNYKKMIDDIVEERLNNIEFEKLNSIKSEFDPMIPADYLQSGSLNPVQIVIDQIIDFFERLSFDIIFDNEITTTDLNFTKLNIKDDHPARSLSDTFYISDKELLRVHCTSVTVKVLQEKNKQSEIKSVAFGNVFRKDDDDATHSHQFNQIDIVWVKEGLSISNLKWLIDALMKHLFKKNTKTRFRLSQFPFTEPSMEVDISCFVCDGKGCNVCKKTGWIEILGSGLLHPNVLKNAGIDSNKFSGIAAGLGIDRIVMLKYGINDIRYIYENDFRILKQFRGK